MSIVTSFSPDYSREQAHVHRWWIHSTTLNDQQQFINWPSPWAESPWSMGLASGPKMFSIYPQLSQRCTTSQPVSFLAFLWPCFLPVACLCYQKVPLVLCQAHHIEDTFTIGILHSVRMLFALFEYCSSKLWVYTFTATVKCVRESL